MNKITYHAEDETDTKVRVYSGGLRVGTIKQETEAGSVGYRYYPRGNKYGGDFYKSLTACKRSLEG